MSQVRQKYKFYLIQNLIFTTSKFLEQYTKINAWKALQIVNIWHSNQYCNASTALNEQFIQSKIGRDKE